MSHNLEVKSLDRLVGAPSLSSGWSDGDEVGGDVSIAYIKPVRIPANDSSFNFPYDPVNLLSICKGAHDLSRWIRLRTNQETTFSMDDPGTGPTPTAAPTRAAEQNSLSLSPPNKPWKNDPTPINPFCKLQGSPISVTPVEKLEEGWGAKVPAAQVKDEGGEGRELVLVEAGQGHGVLDTVFVPTGCAEVRLEKGISVRLREGRVVETFEGHGTVPDVAGVTVANGPDPLLNPIEHLLIRLLLR